MKKSFPKTLRDYIIQKPVKINSNFNTSKTTVPRPPKLQTDKRSQERVEYALKAAEYRKELFQKQRSELRRRAQEKNKNFKF